MHGGARVRGFSIIHLEERLKNPILRNRLFSAVDAVVRQRKPLHMRSFEQKARECEVDGANNEEETDLSLMRARADAGNKPVSFPADIDIGERRELLTEVFAPPKSSLPSVRSLLAGDGGGESTLCGSRGAKNNESEEKECVESAANTAALDKLAKRPYAIGQVPPPDTFDYWVAIGGPTRPRSGQMPTPAYGSTPMETALVVEYDAWVQLRGRHVVFGSIRVEDGKAGLLSFIEFAGGTRHLVSHQQVRPVFRSRQMFNEVWETLEAESKAELDAAKRECESPRIGKIQRETMGHVVMRDRVPSAAANECAASGLGGVAAARTANPLHPSAATSSLTPILVLQALLPPAEQVVGLQPFDTGELEWTEVLLQNGDDLPPSARRCRATVPEVDLNDPDRVSVCRIVTLPRDVLRWNHDENGTATQENEGSAWVVPVEGSTPTTWIGKVIGVEGMELPLGGGFSEYEHGATVPTSKSHPECLVRVKIVSHATNVLLSHLRLFEQRRWCQHLLKRHNHGVASCGTHGFPCHGTCHKNQEHRAPKNRTCRLGYLLALVDVSARDLVAEGMENHIVSDATSSCQKQGGCSSGSTPAATNLTDGVNDVLRPVLTQLCDNPHLVPHNVTALACLAMNQCWKFVCSGKNAKAQIIYKTKYKTKVCVLFPAGL